MPPQRPRHSVQASSPSSLAAPSLPSEVHALDAKIKLISQRMKVIENNEQVIGRTLVSVNKKIKEIEVAVAAAGGKVDLSPLKAELLAEVKKEVDALAPPPLPVMETYPERGAPREVRRAEEMGSEARREVQKLREELEEMRYVLDSINPMAYVTFDSLGDLIDRKVEEALEKRGEKRG